jgi:hypothetical protein
MRLHCKRNEDRVYGFLLRVRFHHSGREKRGACGTPLIQVTVVGTGTRHHVSDDASVDARAGIRHPNCAGFGRKVKDFHPVPSREPWERGAQTSSSVATAAIRGRERCSTPTSTGCGLGQSTSGNGNELRVHTRGERGANAPFFFFDTHPYALRRKREFTRLSRARRGLAAPTAPRAGEMEPVFPGLLCH